MDDCHTGKLLVEYLDKDLDFAQSRKVKNHLNECASCKKKIRELKILYSAFKNETELSSPKRLEIDFYDMLEKEKKKNCRINNINFEGRLKKNKLKYSVLKIAASIALFISTFMLGKYQQTLENETIVSSLKNENVEYKKIALRSLMESKSASSRIQAMNYIDEFPDNQKIVVVALIEKMVFDENTNVRIAAVERLSNFTEFENVEEVLISLLDNENDPRIQITIIDALVKIENKDFTETIQLLLERENTQFFV